jgi:hypothetical protein
MEKLLGFIIGPDAESRKLTAFFYEASPSVTQWYFRLRKRLYGENGKSIGANVAAYLEESRQRIDWQVVRLYRARNGIAHASALPLWLPDLINHTHYYLTNLIAICVHYRETAGSTPSVEILSERAGL